MIPEFVCDVVTLTGCFCFNSLEGMSSLIVGICRPLADTCSKTLVDYLKPSGIGEFSSLYKQPFVLYCTVREFGECLI